MKLTAAKCPNCKNNLKIPEGEKKVTCEYCRQTIYVEDDGINIKIGLDESLKDSFEVVKKTGTTIFAGIAISYAVTAVIAAIIFIGIFIFFGVMIYKNIKASDESSLFNNGETINEKIDSFKQQYNTDDFNWTYEHRNGEQYGSSVKMTMDSIITNNKKNSSHIITIKYKEKDYSESNDITSLKKQFEDFTKYEVQFDYDDDGYINVMNIMDLNKK